MDITIIRGGINTIKMESWKLNAPIDPNDQITPTNTTILQIRTIFNDLKKMNNNNDVTPIDKAINKPSSPFSFAPTATLMCGIPETLTSPNCFSNP